MDTSQVIRPDDPFEPVVESLLGRPVDSPEWRDAAEVATAADINEALRQLALGVTGARLRQAAIYALRDQLQAEYPHLADSA